MIAPMDAGRAVPTWGVSLGSMLILTSLTPPTGSVAVPRSSNHGWLSMCGSSPLWWTAATRTVAENDEISTFRESISGFVLTRFLGMVGSRLVSRAAIGESAGASSSGPKSNEVLRRIQCRHRRGGTSRLEGLDARQPKARAGCLRLCVGTVEGRSSGDRTSDRCSRRSSSRRRRTRCCQNPCCSGESFRPTVRRAAVICRWATS